MSSLGSTQPIVPVFTGEHYDFWSITMRTYLLSQDLWDIVNTGFTIPEDASSKSTQQQELSKEDKQKDAKALCYIHQTVADSIFPRIMGATTAKDAWNTLKEEFQGNTKRMDALHAERAEKMLKLHKIVGKLQLVVLQFLTDSDELRKEKHDLFISQLYASLDATFDATEEQTEGQIESVEGMKEKANASSPNEQMEVQMESINVSMDAAEEQMEGEIESIEGMKEKANASSPKEECMEEKTILSLYGLKAPLPKEQKALFQRRLRLNERKKALGQRTTAVLQKITAVQWLIAPSLSSQGHVETKLEGGKESETELAHLETQLARLKTQLEGVKESARLETEPEVGKESAHVRTELEDEKGNAPIETEMGSRKRKSLE
ncbi:uncharacterized protein LOC143878849 [Tasmannia lanceolata]|uniref:uncharacterized protein LOC143878849 n=1 Tax=Tasmannia lanceolata TaxID=3420 RepID=UPI004063F1EF